MPPDAELLMIFIVQVFLLPLSWIFTFFGVLALTLFIYFRFKELLSPS